MASIQGIYVALFGRPADPAGLAFFNTATNNGADLSSIGDLSGSAEYQDRFEGQNNVSIVTQIYQSLFGRDPDAAGLAFFVAALNSGTQDINTIAINILDGARNEDLTVVNNKIAAANLFTSAIDTPIELGSYIGDDAAAVGRGFIAGVTTTPATAAQAATAVQQVVDTGTAGNTFAIATGSDVSTTLGNGAAPANFTTDQNDIVTVTGAYANTTDINGGLGFDRANIELAGAVVTTATNFVGVERLDITATAVASLNVALSTDLQQIWSNGAAAANDLLVTGIELGTIVGVAGAGANDSIFTFADAAGGDDSATLSVRAAVNAGVVSVDAIENLTINVDGPSSLNLDASNAETIVVTGSGDLTLVSSAGTFSAESIDASGHIGKLIVTTGAVTGELSITGGASNDVFNVSANAEGVTLTGGAGADLFAFGTINNINGANAAALETSLTDDILKITDFNGSADTLSIDLIGTQAEFNNVEQANIDGATTLSATLAAVAAATAVGEFATFQFDGSTYIYDNNGAAAFDAGDGLVELVGFTGELTSSNFTAII